MAAAALNGTGIQFLFQRFAVAIDAGQVRCQPHGNTRFGFQHLGFLLVAVAAGALLIFGVKQLFLFRVIFVVTAVTFIFMGNCMAIMKRCIQTEGHPG